MIPLSVRMTGWMRYRDETVADLTGGNLIAICGENGAGKSSIFDAITFALYGKTRLGKQDVKDLISQDENRLSVDFEFEQQGVRYLVRRGRTDKTGGADQSIFFWDDAKRDYVRVPGSEKREAFQRVVESIVRLSEDAFTSSFLLQQGEATQFIDSDPRDRFGIISSLIGLKEYERLEKAARDAARTAKDRIDWIGARLAEIGEVDEATIAVMRADVEAAAAREHQATDLLEAAKTMLADATRYTRLSREIADLDEKIATANSLLAQKEQIESDAKLFETLAAAFDGVMRIEKALADAARADAAAEAAQRDAAAIDLEALAASHSSASDAVKAATKQQQSAEKAHAAAATSERDAHDFAQIAAALLTARADAASFDERIKQIDAELKRLSTAGKKLDADAIAAKDGLVEVEAALEAARKQAAESQARLESLKEELSQRKEAVKEARCKRCGQPIDKKTAKQQIDELSARFEETRAAANDALAAERSAITAVTAAKKRVDETAKALTAHQRESGKLDGERTSAVEHRERAGVTVAEHEARLDGRLRDVPGAAERHAEAKTRLAEAQSVLEAGREALDVARTDEEAARTALDEATRRRADLDAMVREQSAIADGRRKLAESTAAGLRREFTDELADRALANSSRLLADLRENQQVLTEAPERKAALDRAQKEHDAATGQRSAKQQEVDEIPAAHHVDEALAREAAREAEATAAAARAEHHAAGERLATAERHVDQVRQLTCEHDAAKVRHQRLQRLTKLLGKSGLQGELVRGAINDIKNHANAFLQRLTGGTLQMTLEEVKGTLELQAIDHTCMREPRSAKALSGSQKFRCAVAIASGIGQYAGAGGMRSIVIDEGFASLDVDSQKMMVDELKQLATHMERVIVVSHLEAFNDAVNFPDRLLVRRTPDGASTIERLTP
jgi:exonuclease SbcC